jgi:hypothetical protein
MQDTAPYTIVNDFISLNINGYDYINDYKAMEIMRKYKKVILAEQFNSPIDFLPVEITHLILGFQFNQVLNNLPSALKSLIVISSIYGPLTSEFSKPLNNLPYGLEELVLNARLNNVYFGDNLPPTLKTLIINNYGIGMLTTKIDFAALPDSIEHITCPRQLIKYIGDKLPTNLKEFDVPFLHKSDYKILHQKFPNVKFL